MSRRLEPAYPSFTLVLNDAFDLFRPPPYQSSWDENCHTYSAHYPIRSEEPLMTTVDYRYDDPPFVATVTWDEFWEPNQEASNLQAALKTSDSSPEVTKRRRFSDLVVDLALVIKRKCTVRSFLYSRKTPLSTLTNLDLAS